MERFGKMTLSIRNLDPAVAMHHLTTALRPVKRKVADVYRLHELVDGAADHQRLSFLDAYLGYNQIPMYPRDEAKIAFITDSANFCYRVMSFGLKNAGATYQRLMDKIFSRQIRACLEVYVDDIVIKSNFATDHLKDLKTIFDEVRRHHMRLNPAKCKFGVAGGKFLGFMLSNRGIEANPDKCQAVINMRSPLNVKEIMKAHVRWTPAYRCTPQSSTKETPFRLTYGTDAMVPVEVGEPSLRRTQFNEDANGEALNIELDLVEEVREQALANMEACRTRAVRKIRTKVRPREFQAGDLVWRVIEEARKDKAQGKLAPNWDGPFRIMHNLQNGAYKLEELNGKVIPRT
uniref:Transposon Ty3-I Gag-Pol polyprotein n=1 Tax=Cajanus cajan TaxID=3821 RepID=A0A151QTZ5_CAJCA|nr:Transposon Ty3-I Gag-Pol polyprotein [Cajanus cajan]